MILIRFPSKK